MTSKPHSRTHTLAWTSILPPPADCPHTEDCQGCYIDGLEEQLEAADKFKAAMVRANQRQVDEITSLREQLETAHSDRDDYKRDYFEAHAELRGLREQLDALVAIIMDPDLDLDVAAANAQDYIAGLNPASELTPLQRAYGGKVRTVSTDPSNPATERPLYTDGSLTATPLPPGAEDGPSSPASRSEP